MCIVFIVGVTFIDISEHIGLRTQSANKLSLKLKRRKVVALYHRVMHIVHWLSRQLKQVQ